MKRYTNNVTRVTLKQKKYIQKYVETGGNGTQAALEAYDTINPLTAAAISSENLTKPYIQEEIDKILKDKNLTLEQNLDNITRIANGTPETKLSADVVLKANLELARLRGADMGHKTSHSTVSFKANLSSKSFQDLIELNKQTNKELEDIMGS